MATTEGGCTGRKDYHTLIWSVGGPDRHRGGDALDGKTNKLGQVCKFGVEFDTTDFHSQQDYLGCVDEEVNILKCSKQLPDILQISIAVSESTSSSIKLVYS